MPVFLVLQSVSVCWPSLNWLIKDGANVQTMERAATLFVDISLRACCLSIWKMEHSTQILAFFSEAAKR